MQSGEHQVYLLNLDFLSVVALPYCYWIELGQADTAHVKARGSHTA